jgi:membrane protease YdiL (CAAX protease family)
MKTFTILDKKGKAQTEQKSEITLAVIIFVVIASSIMFVIGLGHINDIDAYGKAWGQFALLQATFCMVGYVGKQQIDHQPLFPNKQQRKPINLDTGLRALIIILAAKVVQNLTSYALAINIQEQALYYLFASVAEEVFFRMFLISLITRKNKSFGMQAVAVVVQAAIFAGMHQNYWGSPDILLGVFIGGILLGVFYLMWHDITANIFGHFLLNFIAVASWLVVL